MGIVEKQKVQRSRERGRKKRGDKEREQEELETLIVVDPVAAQRPR